MFDFVFLENLPIETFRKNRIANIVKLFEIKSKQDLTKLKKIEWEYFNKINVYYGVIVDVPINNIFNILAELFYNPKIFIDLVLVRARDFTYNRKVISKYFFNGLLNPGIIAVEDHPLVRYIAIPTKHLKKIKENRLAVFFSVNDISKDYIYLGRVIYLIKILQKKKIPIIIGSFAKKETELLHKKQLISWKKILGIKYSSKQIFNDFVVEQIKRTRDAKNSLVFAEGYKVVRLYGEDCTEF